MLFVQKSCGQKYLAQQINKTCCERHHCKYKQARNHQTEPQIQRISDEERCDDHANEERTARRQENRAIDFLCPLEQHIDFCLLSSGGLFCRLTIPSIESRFQRTVAINDPREPISQHQHIGSNTREQKHWGNRQLNNVSDVIRSDLHESASALSIASNFKK